MLLSTSHVLNCFDKLSIYKHFRLKQEIKSMQSFPEKMSLMVRRVIKMHVCMYLCMSLCEHLCSSILCMYVNLFLCIHLCVYLCVSMCISVCCCVNILYVCFYMSVEIRTQSQILVFDLRQDFICFCCCFPLHLLGQCLATFWGFSYFVFDPVI